MPHTENKSLLDALNRCAEACAHCANACLDEEHVKQLAHCIRLDMDCASICRLVAGYIARGSEHARLLLPVCASVCEDCARECRIHAQMDHCAECAEECTACAEACRTLGRSLAA